MSMAEEFERAIGDGPPHLPLSVRLAAGRRAVRRRRVGRAVAAMALLVAMGATLPAALDRAEGAGEVASDVQATDPYGAIAPEDRRPEPVLTRDEPVGIDLAGDLVALDGVRVRRTIDNPLSQAPPAYSVGVEFSFEGRIHWRLLHVDATSSGVAGDGLVAEGPSTPAARTTPRWVMGWSPRSLVGLAFACLGLAEGGSGVR